MVKVAGEVKKDAPTETPPPLPDVDTVTIPVD
jgi:hypothetical protein